MGFSIPTIWGSSYGKPHVGYTNGKKLVAEVVADPWGLFPWFLEPSLGDLNLLPGVLVRFHETFVESQAVRHRSAVHWWIYANTIEIQWNPILFVHYFFNVAIRSNHAVANKTLHRKVMYPHVFFVFLKPNRHCRWYLVSDPWWIQAGTAKNSPWLTWHMGFMYDESMINMVWLVVWNIFYFPTYWEFHHPNWLSYSSEGWLKTTKQWSYGWWLTCPKKMVWLGHHCSGTYPRWLTWTLLHQTWWVSLQLSPVGAMATWCAGTRGNPGQGHSIVFQLKVSSNLPGITKNISSFSCLLPEIAFQLLEDWAIFDALGDPRSWTRWSSFSIASWSLAVNNDEFGMYW